jgi:hypothetical protein
VTCIDANYARTRTWLQPVFTHGMLYSQVCLAARDNNPICYGKGPAKATPEGWFGEEQCIIYEVRLGKCVELQVFLIKSSNTALIHNLVLMKKMPQIKR